MVNGLAFFSWDTRMGATLEMKYPLDLELSDDLINKIYMTHSYEEDFTKEELIEIAYEDLIILSFCDKSKIAEKGYEIFVMILEERERISLYKLKTKFIDFVKTNLRKSSKDRKKYFIENINIFFDESSSKKFLLLGRAGTGKTTIKKIVFEGYDPNELLSNSLEPTRGIIPSVYSWLDLKLGLFDSSGQELSDILENREDNQHFFVFENTNIIIYVLDYPTWSSNSRLIIGDLQEISEIIKKHSFSTRLILFFHKIDLIKKETRKKILKEITNQIKSKFDISIYYTSIYPYLIYSLYNAFYELLSSFSKENQYLKNILDNMVKEHSKTMFFITNLNDNIIVQSISHDFNTTIINHSHNLITQLNKTFENMVKNDQIEHLILSSLNINIIMNSLNYQKFGLKNLICFSETLSANKLIWIIGQIRLKLKKIYYLNKEFA
ncbi:MAG: ADP-ribosylation factor-like protein [Promethearchaeota archaeon]